jgi:antitoxin MazE
MAVITKVRKIGNSKGILFPKTILEKSGIKDTVQLTVKNNEIIIAPKASKTKKQWSDFKKVKKEKSDFVVNKFDQTEWTW